MTTRPGDLIGDPLALGALVVLAVNDHLLKAAFPGFLTGKVSDAAGLILVPFYLAGAAEILAWLAARQWRASVDAFALLALATGIGFAAVKTIAGANVLYEHALGVAQWALTAPFALVTGSPIGLPRPAALVADPSDLLALPVLALAIWARSQSRWRGGLKGATGHPIRHPGRWRRIRHTCATTNSGTSERCARPGPRPDAARSRVSY
jgi:hypothetical protein